MLLAGSLPVTMLVPLRNADFQLPKTAVGGTGVPPHCQSWQREEFIGTAAVQMRPGVAVTSVMNSAGTKVATFPDGGVNGETGKLDVLTPSRSA